MINTTYGNYNPYDLYGAYNVGTASAKAGLDGKPIEKVDVDGKPVDKYDPDKKPGRKSSPEECETCKNRTYQDGSNEMVSFKSPSHISPEAAGAAVRAHEGEHVSNAYKKAAEGDGKVLRASVSIHTSTCPECGRVYVSGGDTTTQIKYSDEKNPYQQNAKSQDQAALAGANVNYTL